MELWMWLVAAVLVGGVINAAMQAESGNGLAQKFVALGNMMGKTEEEIIAAVGEPTARSVIGPGLILLQWQKANYHIALKFKDGLCEGVTHESLVKPS